MKEWEREALELKSKIESLTDEEERIVMRYFIRYRSVGILIALAELKNEGVKDPEEVIVRLIEKGLLEKGAASINLPAALRRYIGRGRGRINI
ncbi:MAG: hypothetical protein F7C32_00740 [Desulfurococcales archaeon]|nr:hypothetical protein [Desulfurococcales archaeon]